MAWFNRIYHNFRSDIDKMLDQFNASHPLSPSQQAEVDKHAPIQHKRDHKVSGKTTSDNDVKDVWDKF